MGYLTQFSLELESKPRAFNSQWCGAMLLFISIYVFSCSEIRKIIHRDWSAPHIPCAVKHAGIANSPAVMAQCRLLRASPVWPRVWRNEDTNNSNFCFRVCSRPFTCAHVSKQLYRNVSVLKKTNRRSNALLLVSLLFVFIPLMWSFLKVLSHIT